MAKKVKFYQIWETRNIIITVGTIMFLILFIAFLSLYPQIRMYTNKSRFKGITKGLLLDVKERKVISQSIMGNKVTSQTYELEYSYKINGEIYKRFEIINRIEKLRYLKEELDKAWSTDKVIKIRYNPDKPEESIVVKE